MSGKGVWAVFGIAVLALAGCMTTGGLNSSSPQARAELPPPQSLKGCGRTVVGSTFFEMCGIGPEGKQAEAVPHKIYTEICGPVEVTQEIKAYLCQKADSMFDTINPRRTNEVIAASFPDRTRAFYSANLGNEVQYLAPNGTGYFWLSHQRNVLVGQWMIYRNQQVCYFVPGMTEHPGTKWICGPVRPRNLTEIAQGDVLGLAKRGNKPAPFVLEPQPHITLAEIKQRLDSPTAPRPPSAEPPAQEPSKPVPTDPLGPMVMNEY